MQPNYTNLCVSEIAKKHDLHVSYSSREKIESMGIELYSGKNNYNKTNTLHDNNYFETLNKDSIDYNLNSDKHFFQTKEISLFLYNYLQKEDVRNNIIKHNQYSERYNTNNDCFIHIRLTDADNLNPGLDYYIKALTMITFNNLYIASDDLNHTIIKQLQYKYPNTVLIDYNDVDTIKFGSTNKYVILSHGSYSSTIGYLSFYSTIYYPFFDKIPRSWHGDLFSIPTWNKIEY